MDYHKSYYMYVSYSDKQKILPRANILNTDQPRSYYVRYSDKQKDSPKAKYQADRIRKGVRFVHGIEQDLTERRQLKRVDIK